MVKLVGSKTVSFLRATGGYLWQFLRNPLIIKSWSAYAWAATKEMASHTWHGFKLLGVEVSTSSQLLRKRLAGHQLTRRERRQFLR